MIIEELEDRHLDLKWTEYMSNKEHADLHTKLSIQFAIEVLEETAKLCFSDRSIVEDKIQELKTYLDEKIE